MVWLMPAMAPILPAKPLDMPPPSLPPWLRPMVSLAPPNDFSMAFPTPCMLGTIWT